MLRHLLDGVIGAWYWDRHAQIFDTWLAMLVADSRQRGSTDGAASLLALSKIRYVEGAAYIKPDSNSDKAETDALRAQIAQRTDPAGGSSRLALNDKINTGLDTLRADFHRKFAFLSNAGLQEYLRSLANDETVLTYHLGPRMAQVWVAQKGGVQRRDIANPAELYREARETRQGLDNIGLNAFNRKMDDLGERLLTPVADLLTETIYWIPAGPLMAFPVDALRVNGRYFLERHHVVNLLSFPANPHPANSLQAGELQSIFLAGNPQDYAGDYATRLETSVEIQAIADLFVGPGLQILQGVALLPDEFQGGYFSQSKLVHLSMPGVINLKYPDDSGLELSESEYEPGRVVLMSTDVRSQKLVASLVFLSSTRSADSPRSDFGSQPGLVADFFSAGARSVVVNFWATNAESDALFITDFYRTLKDSGNISESLRKSRLQYLKNSRENGLYDWAGYQLYIK
jgi:CHAT domain-containing protein